MNIYHKNPRSITKKQVEKLKRDIEELGDLSGVIHDINTNELVGGNQRSRVFDIDNCEIEIIKEYKTPTRTGTVAEGYIIYKGERYTYRKVDWTPEQCEKANIVANKAGGRWDFDILANEFDVDNLLDWGFEEFEFVGNEQNINESKELDADDIGDMMVIKLEYSFDEYKAVQEAIKECGNTPEAVLWDALNCGKDV